MKVAHNNEIIKQLKKQKNKNVNNEMVIEGLELIKEVLINDIEIKSLVYCSEELSNEAETLLKECMSRTKNQYEISLKTFESIREKENSVPIILIVKFKEMSLEDIDYNKHKIILINDSLELPGNLGTIYRSAYASGVDLIINIDSKTNIYKEKFLLSSRGTVFKIPTINSNYEEVKNILIKQGYDILLCEPKEGIKFNEFSYENSCAIVVGNERFGINEKWFKQDQKRIYIPMKPDMNSINVSVAASIILFEVGIKKGKI